MKKKLYAITRLLPVYVMYAAGMAALYGIDVVISISGNLEAISKWAFIKSSVMIGAFLATAGFDQVVIRSPEAFGTRVCLKVLAITICISALTAAALSAFRDDVGFPVLAGMVLGVSLSTLISAWYRSSFRLLRAQMASNLWKVVVLSIVSFLLFYEYGELDIDRVVGVASTIVIVAFLPLFLRLIRISTDRKVDESESVYRSALRFLLMGGTLNLSVNLEQVILSAFGHEEAGAVLFAHLTAFGFIFYAANGFYGFVLGPYVRRVKGSPQVHVKIGVSNIFVSLSMAGVSVFSGWLVFDHVYKEKVELTTIYAAFVIAVMFLRCCYVFPSAFVSFVAPAAALRRYTTMNVGALLVLISLSSALLFAGFDPVLAVLLSSLSNWLIRVVSGYVISFRELRRI